MLLRLSSTPRLPNGLYALVTSRSFRVRGRVKRGELIENIPIERLDADGNGRTTLEWNRFRGCSFNDTELVVPGALPGETVTVKIGGVRGNGKKYNEVFVHVFARRNYAVEPGSFGSPKLWMNSTDILDYHKDSPYEIPEEQVCAFFDKRHDELSCSGCQIPHLQYQRQLLWKRKLLTEIIPHQFEHKQDSDGLLPIIASGLEPYKEHRTYSQIMHSPDRWDPPVIGHYARKANAPGERREIITTGGRCPRKEPPTSEAERVIMEVLARQYTVDREYYSAYDFWRHRGNFMGLSFHVGKDADGRRHMLVNILLTMELDRERMQPLVDALTGIPQVRAIVANRVDRVYYPGFNIKSDDRNQMLLYGDEPYIPHTLMVGQRKIPIKIGVGDVLWSNVTIHKQILDTVSEFARPEKGDVVWDLWAGNGVTSLTLAGKCRHIVAIDASRTRVNGLKENLKLNPELAANVTPVLANIYREETLVYLSGHIHRNRALQLLETAYTSLEDARKLRGFGVVQGINRTKSLERKHARQFTELPTEVSEVLKAEAKLALAEGTVEGDKRFNILVKHLRSTKTPEGLQPLLPIKQPWMIELTPQMQQNITAAYQKVRSRIDRGEAADDVIQTPEEAERESQLVDAAYMWLMNKDKPTRVQQQLAESEERRLSPSVEPVERAPALPGAGRPYYSWETLDKAKEKEGGDKDDASTDLTVTNKDAIEQLNEEGPVFEISLTARSSSGEDDGDAEDVAQRELVRSRSQDWRTSTLPSPDVVVISFPPKSKKSEKEGSLPKLFRRWLRASAVKRIVGVFTDPKGLSKDVGHLKQLGYSPDDIRVIDAQPGTMEVVVIVELNLKSVRSHDRAAAVDNINVIGEATGAPDKLPG